DVAREEACAVRLGGRAAAAQPERRDPRAGEDALAVGVGTEGVGRRKRTLRENGQQEKRAHACAPTTANTACKGRPAEASCVSGDAAPIARAGPGAPAPGARTGGRSPRIGNTSEECDYPSPCRGCTSSRRRRGRPSRRSSIDSAWPQLE